MVTIVKARIGRTRPPSWTFNCQKFLSVLGFMLLETVRQIQIIAKKLEKTNEL